MLRKIFLLALMFVFVNVTASAQIRIDYGTSAIYSKEDMDVAISIVMDKFMEWCGCEMRSIRYYEDECNSSENIAWVNEHQHSDGDFVEAICFLTDFYVSKDALENGLALNPDFEYKNYQWWLARSEGGDWQFVDAGY